MLQHVTAVLLFSVLASSAHADSRALGEGFALSIDNSDLYVVKGKQRARLVRASAFKSLTVDKAKRKVVVDVEDDTCIGNTKHEWTFAHLDARLENWSAYALYKKKDFKVAAASFEKAAKHDPAWRIAAYNLASAHQLAGDKAAAISALAPWLQSEPIATYVQVSSDPELAPLLDRPELKTIRAKQAGNAKVTTTGLDVPALYSKERNLIAFAREESGWGSSAYVIDIEIYDAKTGALVSSTPLVKWDDTMHEARGLNRAGKKAASERAARFQTMLVNLGFSNAKVEKGPTPKEDDATMKMKVVFPKAKLGVVATPDVANALRGNAQVGTVKSEGKMRSAIFVEDANVVVLTTQRHQAEGCDGGPEIGVYVMPIKP